ncbi:unnamed protein product, partial [Prorocentrum cordatum]
AAPRGPARGALPVSPPLPVAPSRPPPPDPRRLCPRPPGPRSLRQRRGGAPVAEQLPGGLLAPSAGPGHARLPPRRLRGGAASPRAGGRPGRRRGRRRGGRPGAAPGRAGGRRRACWPRIPSRSRSSGWCSSPRSRRCIFLKAAASLRVSGLAGLAGRLGFPCPGFLGLLGFLTLLVGPALVLVGPFVHCALASIVGAKMLLVFLAVATYTGHWKPMRSAEDDTSAVFHMRAVMGNLSIMGGCVAIVGFALRDLHCTGVFQPYFQWWRYHSFFVVEFGRVVLVLTFLKSAFQLRIRGFVGIATHFGFPCAPIMGFGAFASNLVGSACVVIGPLLPRALLAASTSIAGALLLIVFLVVATYVGHFRALGAGTGQEQREHVLLLAKNVSVVGALITVIGFDLAGL